MVEPLHCPHIYQQSLALLTDLYQITMAYGYWKNGLDQKEAVFSSIFSQKLQEAEKGDYIVATINRIYTVLIVREKMGNTLSIEEISVPKAAVMSQKPWRGWRSWVESDAPGHCTWVLYTFQLPSGALEGCYNYARHSWARGSQASSFISTLLGLQLRRLATKEMKKVGPKPPPGAPDRRKLWQPRMIFEGQTIPGVPFSAWFTRWPNDRSELSGRQIILYLPESSTYYPAYFPYWLQIRGFLGKAKVRIVDSGRGLHSPKPLPQYN